VARTLEQKGFFYTSSHSGDPVLTAAGVATLDILLKQNLLQNVREMGAYLMDGLEALRDQFDIVGDVRGLGLKLGIEFVEDKTSRTRSPRATREFTVRCRDKGLILGNNPEASNNIIRILPAFSITREQVDQGLRIMEAALAETTRVLQGDESPADAVALSAPAR
jgi:4-aminobutyrate aminotransferase-like enzyme